MDYIFKKRMKMQPEENRIPLKTFKVITNDPEIGEMKIDVESENEESLIKESNIIYFLKE